MLALVAMGQNPGERWRNPLPPGRLIRLGRAPLDSVELNNELVQLAEEEREEEQRILRAWADALRERLPEVRETLARLAELDSVQARARFAERAGASLARDAVDERVVGDSAGCLQVLNQSLERDRAVPKRPDIKVRGRFGQA